ncbi:MAG: hypothetical protein CK530_04725 [Planctomycetaceae bacterium]|nr:MAG: hypothetical protein CK530_10880 [Planctomycetaceae bacterium]PHY02646.1 MAG: hypothetical protein CK530_04725 [Planctomycetaceae bacterium]
MQNTLPIKVGKVAMLLAATSLLSDTMTARGGKRDRRPSLSSGHSVSKRKSRLQPTAVQSEKLMPQTEA